MREQNTACLPIIFSKVKKAVQKRQTELLKPYGLGSIHAMYLIILLHNPSGLTMRELCVTLYVDKANTSRAISTLEEKDYVFRDSSGTGVLKYKIMLSKKGKELAYLITEKMKRFHEEMFRDLTSDEINTMRRVLQKIELTVDEME